MANMMQREIEKLEQRVVQLAEVVQSRLSSALDAVINRNTVVAHAVIEGDTEIDEMEVDLEEECLKVLTLHQPVALDLRFIIAVLKINNELERIGDLAVNIATRAKSLSQRQSAVPPPFDIAAMGAKVQKMVQGSMKALGYGDTDAAREVWRYDSEIDQIHANVFIEVERRILANPEEATALLEFLSISRYLERIADSATNIAEDVVYHVEGTIVRHQRL